MSNQENANKGRVENLAVYSTFCGATKHKTFLNCPVDSRYPHYFVSNNQDVLAESSGLGWLPILLDIEVSENSVVSAYQAKIAKAIPHAFRELADFDYLFYKDDKIDLNIDRMGEFVSILQASDSPLAIRRHPFLPPNVLHEFGEAMLQPRYKDEWTQTVKYITEELENGFKLECDNLFWTSAILRNMKHPAIQELNNTWCEHIYRCGIECQISFHFIAQRFSSITLLPLDLT